MSTDVPDADPISEEDYAVYHAENAADQLRAGDRDAAVYSLTAALTNLLAPEFAPPEQGGDA